MFVLASGKGEETLLKDPGLAFPNLTNFQGAPILSIGVAELRVVKGKIQVDSLMRGSVYHSQNQHEGKSAAISVHCLLKEDNGGPSFFGSGRLGVSLFVNNALGQNTGETLIMNKTAIRDRSSLEDIEILNILEMDTETYTNLVQKASENMVAWFNKPILNNSNTRIVLSRRT